MTYYMLRCQTCKEDFRRLLATSEDELLYPDYEEVAETAGSHNAESLEAFHDQHHGHVLRAVEDSTVDVPNPPRPQPSSQTKRKSR